MGVLVPCLHVWLVVCPWRKNQDPSASSLLDFSQPTPGPRVAMTRLAAVMVWVTPAVAMASSPETSLRGAQVRAECWCLVNLALISQHNLSTGGLHSRTQTLFEAAVARMARDRSARLCFGLISRRIQAHTQSRDTHIRQESKDTSTHFHRTRFTSQPCNEFRLSGGTFDIFLK